MTKQNTGRRGGFWKGLGLFFVGMLVLTAVLCALLWQALKKYEAGTPAAAMRRYLVQVQQQEYDQLYEASGFTPTEFTGKEEYIAYLKHLYDGQNLSQAIFNQRTGGADGRRLYAVMANGSPIADLDVWQETENGPWQVRTHLDLDGWYEVLAPEDTDVWVNGVLLAPEEADTTLAPAYAGLPETVSGPQMTLYRVTGVLGEPDVTAESENGRCAVEQSDPEEGEDAPLGVYTVLLKPDKKTAETYKDLAQKAAETYATFISKDTDRSVMLAQLIYGSEFHKRVASYNNIWYAEHTSHEFEDMEITELLCYGENAFTCHVSFTYKVSCSGGREYEYPSQYDMAFLKTGGRWKLADLVTE